MRGVLHIFGRTGAVALLAVVVMFFAPAVGNAQNANPALSFDPAVNPALKGYEYNSSNGPAGQPRTGPNGQCVLYNAPKVLGISTGVVSGCVKDGVFTIDGTAPAATGEAVQVRTDSEGAVATGARSGDECSLQGWGNIGICIAEGLSSLMSKIVGGLAYVVLAIASFILWIVGGMFNWVVIKTVFQFGSTFGTSDGMLIAWGILRDIGNIILLFSFIFMGIATILNTHALDEYSARKALPRLIIFAVLLNFSLFAAQIVIDVSNSMASVFTVQAGLKDCTEGTDVVGADGRPSQEACANDGIAGRVIHMAGISSVWRTTDLGTFMNQSEKHAPVFIGLAIFVTVTAVVLLAAAIMLIFRAVMLCLLMVLSPIGFAGMAVPPLQEFAKKWWKSLLSNAFFAPIYLLLVLISLKIIEGLIGNNEGKSFAEALINGGTNAPQIFVIFAVVIAFMVASLMVAKQMGAAGADFATKTAGGAVLGAYGVIGRRTFGAAGAAWQKQVVQNRKAGRISPTSARLQFQTAKWLTNQSFSPRGLATTLAKPAHIDFGKPNKTTAHGFHGIEDKEKKNREEFAKALKLNKEQIAELKNIKGLIEEQTELDRNEMSALRQAQTKERTPLQTEIKSAKEALDATQDGTPAHQRALDKWKALVERDRTLQGDHADARSELGNEQKQRMGKLQDREKKAKNAAKQDYIDALHKKYSNRPLKWLPTPESEADHHASESVEDDMNKSKTQKLLEDVKKGIGDAKSKISEVEDAVKSDDEHDH